MFSISTFHFILIILFKFIYTFNVDTDYAIAFHNSRNNTVSNFGAAVAITQYSQKSEFIIGAPRHTSSNGPLRSGTVFKCEVLKKNQSSCSEDSSLFRGKANNNINWGSDRTKDMNLGFSITSKPKHLVVCASTWTNGKRTQYDYPSGECYLIYDQGNAFKLSAFESPTYQTKHANAQYYYSQALSGFSSEVSEPLIALGAPGFSDWQGGVVVYSTANLNNPSIFYDDHDYNSYMGYSIGFGKFFSGNILYIAAGAPRSRETGCVYIFRSDGRNFGTTVSAEGRNKLYTLSNTFRKCGEQFAEYFGASILTVDINNDKFTDLIVGAPFYSPSSRQRGDCGRIFVYMSQGNRFDNPDIISIERNSGARFGSAISNLGDLNYDGYNDIAVGAPYEDNGRGVVYIYHGRRDGLSKYFAQKISAATHLSSLDLKGFGFSFSQGLDVDRNNYPDLLIGSYLSEKAVLLRSRPVGTLKIFLRFLEYNTQQRNSQINLKDTKCLLRSQRMACFDISYCLMLTGQYLPEYQEMQVSFDIDSKHKRRGFASIEGKDLYQFQRFPVIKPNKQECLEPVTIYLQPNIEDKLTQMPITLTANVVKPGDTTTFCETCAILASEPSVTETMDFEIGCGKDGKCTADIKLEITSSFPFIVQGLHHELPVFVTVSNRGENAYSTKLKLVIRPVVELKQINSHCDSEEPSDTLIIRCDIDNPLETDESKDVLFLFGTNRVLSHSTNISISGEVSTTSEMPKTSVSKQKYEVEIKRFASLRVFRDPTSNEILYDDPATSKQEYAKFSTRVQLEKSNHSSVDEVDITFRIPANYKSDAISYTPLITLTTKPMESTSIKCDFSTLSLPLLPGEQSQPKQSGSESTGSGAESTKENDPRVSKREIHTEPALNMSKDEVAALKLDCLVMDCQAISCKVGPFGVDHQLVVIDISSAINLKAVDSAFATNSSGIVLLIDTEAKIVDANIENKRPAKAIIPTLFKRNPSKEPVSTWIIFASSGIGFLLFLIIFILLLKFGFFQRKKHEDLKRLLAQNANRASKYDASEKRPDVNEDLN